MSRPIRSSSGRNASIRMLRASLSWSVDACATDTLANNCMSMAEQVNLDQASDEDLARRIREIMAEMAPLEEALGRLRVQIQQVASEQKKRERSQHLRARMQVRTTVAQGQMPTLQQVAESSNDLVPPDTALTALRFFRDRATSRRAYPCPEQSHREDPPGLRGLYSVERQRLAPRVVSIVTLGVRIRPAQASPSPWLAPRRAATFGAN